MKYSICFTFCIVPLLFLSSELPSQTLDDNSIIMPSPVIGWDSIAKAIKYPDLFVRSGTEGRILVMIYIDTSGKSEDVTVGDLIGCLPGSGSLFDDIVQNYFRNVKWIPALRNGKKINYRVSIPIFFLLSDEQLVKPVVVRRARSHTNK